MFKKPTKLSKKAILDEPHDVPEVETRKEAPKKDKKRKADKKLAGVEVELEGVSKAIKKAKRKVEDKADQVDEKPVEAKSSGKSKKRKVNAEVITKSPPSKKSPKVTPTTASQAKLDTSKKSRKQKKYRSPSPAPEPEESEGVDEDIPPNSEVVDEEPSFFGFSTDDDDDDSSDEEGMGAEIPGIDISKLPTIAKDDATVKRRLEKAKRKPVRFLS